MRAKIATWTALALAFGLALPARAQSEEGADEPPPAEAAPAEPAPADDASAGDAVPVPTTEAAPTTSEAALPRDSARSAAPEPEAPAPEAASTTSEAALPRDSARSPSPKKAARAAKRPSPRVLRAAKLLAQGRQAERAREYGRAIAVYERATRADSSSAEAFLHLGNAYFGRAFARGAESVDKDDAQSAVDAYETALGLDPGLKSVSAPYILYHGLAQCQEALGDYEKALASLKDAAKANPNNPMPHLYGARLRWRMRDIERATANLYWSVRRARKLDMYPQLARLVRSDPMFSGLMGLPHAKVIMDSYDAVHSGVLTEEQAKDRIRSGGASDDLRDAVRDAPTMATSRPRSLTAPVVDEEVLRRVEDGHRAHEAGAFHEAISAYHAALSADERRGTMDAVLKSLVFERLGSSYRRLGHAGEAARVLARAVEALPNNSSARYELALCLAAGGRPGEALSELNRALDTAATVAQLRKVLILSKTDPELAPVRDLPRFRSIVDAHSRKLSARK